jgi:hypothetical protein
MLADARQSAVLFASAGQFALEPVQFSAMSHWPAAPRQVVELGANASAGQFGPLPLQFSATSQTPAASRQTVELGAN